MNESIPGDRDVTRRSRRAIVAATLASAVAVMPVPLVGGLAVLIQAEFGFGDAQLGVAMAGFFLAAAIASAVGGRASVFVGPHWIAWVGLGCIVLALLGTSLIVKDWTGFAVLLALAGVGHALTVLAVGVLLTRAVSLRRQGLAFGGTLALAPLLSMLSGVSVPTIGLTLGWHVVFAACAVIGVLAAITIPVTEGYRGARKLARTTDAPVPALLLLSFGMALSSAGGNAAAVFLVRSSIDAGFSTADAGIVLAIASVAGLFARIGTGWLGDRRGGDAIGLMAAVIGVGAIGYFGLAVAPVGVLTIVASVLAFGGGWGWPGLMLLAVTRSSPSAPGMALGIVSFGGLLGAVGGSLAFGALAETVSFSASWVLLGVAAIVSIIATLASGRWIARSRLAREVGAERAGT